MPLEDVPLTEAQRAAAREDAPRLLVLAGPGTGKTHVLTARIAHLIARGMAPDRIVALTFTLRAARQMRARLHTRLGATAKAIRAGTFHAVAATALRDHGPAAGLVGSWRIASPDEQLQAMQSSLEAAGLGDAERLGARRWLQISGLAVNTETTTRAAVARLAPNLTDAPVAPILDAYARYKADRGWLDFDDLLLHFKALLLSAPGEALVAGIGEVLVDEYQDTTPLQADLARRLADAGRLTAVGDDAQAIYGFRGATAANIRDFAQDPGTRVLGLPDSHRCQPRILDAAQALIRRDPAHLGPPLRTEIRAGPRPAAVRCADADEEAEFIAQRASDHIDAGLPAEQLAVLYRTHAQAGALELALARRRIPARRRGVGHALALPAVRWALALLRLRVAPADRAAWETLLEPIPGIGPKTITRIGPALAAGTGAPPERLATLLADTPRVARAGLEALVEHLREVAHPAVLSAELLDAAAEGRGLGPPPSERAREVLGALARAAANSPSDAELLSDLALDPDPPQDAIAHAAVTLCSVHQAKGLEWSTVFVAGLADGLFPLSAALDAPGGLEEERRLLYVAMTRAKDALYLCHPGSNPSRLLYELPEEAIERWDLT